MQILHQDRALAGGDSGTARNCAGAIAGSACGRTVGIVAGRIAVRNEISAERWKSIRRCGCSRSVGSRNLVGAPIVMGIANSWDDGGSAQRIPVGCRESQLCRGFLSSGSTRAPAVRILNKHIAYDDYINHSGHSNFAVRKAGNDGAPFCCDVEGGGGRIVPMFMGLRVGVVVLYGI